MKELKEYSLLLENSLLSNSSEFMCLVQVRMESALVKELKEYSLLLENSLLSIQEYVSQVNKVK